MEGSTFHHHIHILYSLRDLLNKDEATYTEIGTFNGGSICLMLQNPLKSNIISIDPFHLDKTNISIVENNIKKFNKFGYNVNLTKKFSNDMDHIKELNQTNFKTDILFIDGDHSYDAVISDFKNFNEFIDINGFIVFDDYHDSEHSPDVKRAVDDIVIMIKEQNLPFEIIGSMPNFNKVYPSDLENLNEFILQRK